VHLLKRAVKRLGNRSLIDRRTGVGKALAEWRESLIADLGGPDTVTTQQLAIVDMAVRTKLLADSVDAYVLGMPSPVNKRSRCLYPVVRERQALVSQLQSLLRDLGLERRVQPTQSLATYLAAKEHGPASPVAPVSEAGRRCSTPSTTPPSSAGASAIGPRGRRGTRFSRPSSACR
jgi:hypothetical protein